MSATARALNKSTSAPNELQAKALQGCFRILELWGVSNAQMRRILGAPAERTFFDWKANRVKRLPEDVMRRIGYVAGIFKSLQVVYADALQADAWVKQPNRHFGGQTPLERMAAGDVTDLAAVRDYVVAAGAPWS